jgi:hypothetical protein
MITARSIQRFFTALLIVCSAVVLGVSFYFGWWNVLLVWWLIVMFIFALSFVMELFHVSISDPVLWLLGRFDSRRAKHKIER